MSASPIASQVIDEAFSSAENLLAAYRRARSSGRSGVPCQPNLSALLTGMNLDFDPGFSAELLKEERMQKTQEDATPMQKSRRRRRHERRRNQQHQKGSRLERTLDAQLLDRLTPEMFAEIIRLEVRDADGYVTFKTLAAASFSDQNALRVADLIIRATVFGRREAQLNAQDERIFRILFTGWTPHPIFEGREQESQFYHAPFARLIAMARAGNVVAHNRLRLFWRAVQRFGYELDPVPAATWTEELSQEFLEHSQWTPDPARQIRMPFPCDNKEYPVIRKVVDEEQTVLEHGRRIQNQVAEDISAIGYQYLIDYLSALFECIRDATDRRILRADGGDKVEVRVPMFRECSGLQAFAFFREEQAFPGVGVHLYTDILGYHDVYPMALTPEGDFTGINPSWPNWYRALLCLMILDAYAWIIVKDDEEHAEEAPSGGPPTRRPTRRPLRQRREGTYHVRPFFRSLPSGWHASAAAIANAERIAGESPPEGKTFVCEFDRFFAEFTSRREPTSRDEWSRQSRRPATLVYSEEDLQAVLRGLQSW